MAGFDDEEVEDLDAEEAVDTSDDSEETDDLEEEGYSGSLGDDDIDDFDGDADEDLKVVDDALNHKDQNARALAIRRAIEERQEAKRISKDLDYLDIDLDD